MSDRRTFLRGLVSLPLIGGGVTLIGRPAQAVPLVQVAALPTLDDPRHRARYAWEAFSAAMRELTAHEHGWHVQGGERRSYGYLPGHAFCRPSGIILETGVPGNRALIIDHFREIDL